MRLVLTYSYLNQDYKIRGFAGSVNLPSSHPLACGSELACGEGIEVCTTCHRLPGLMSTISIRCRHRRPVKPRILMLHAGVGRLTLARGIKCEVPEQHGTVATAACDTFAISAIRYATDVPRMPGEGV